MNQKAYLAGYLEKQASLTDRPLAYAANLLPSGSTLYGAANATPQENIVKQGIKTGVGSSLGAVGGAGLGYLSGAGGILAIDHLLNTLDKYRGIIKAKAIGAGPAAVLTGLLMGSLGGIIGGGEATYRLGKKKKLNPEIA